MATAAYLAGRFWYRIADFFRRWYISGSRAFFSHVINRFERFDRVIALKVTARFLFQPLYGDYSVIGYVFGFIFRSIRLILGLVTYAFVFLFYLIIYIAWVLVPPYLLFRMFSS